ncbi:MAG: IS1380 family transposase [Desulfobulbaceae bacterium]|nr:IS1380 family transposase [Desulfobulbaceae bacterium]
MRIPIKVKHGDEKLSSHSGLILIGMLLESTQLRKRLEQILGVHCVDPYFSHADVLFSMIGLISIGKPNYDAIEIFREKPEFFAKALSLSGCPSSVTVRQRIDLIGTKADNIIKEESAAMVSNKAPAITPLKTSSGKLIPLDIDVSPFDNSKTKKMGVSRTYKGCDGFAPIFAYLGREGYLVNLELREGSQHCQKNTPQFIWDTLEYSRKITSAPILMRLDSGNDSKDNFPNPDRYEGVHFIIKRNLRKESLKAWLNLAQREGAQTVNCERKSVWLGKTTIGINGNVLPYPITFKATERYMKKNERFLIPEIEIETYWCNLNDMPPAEVIELYHDHGTSEQFHSEIKSDMGVERLPSGNFSSNSLVLHLTMLSYNMLRIIGQQWVEEDKEIGTKKLPKPRQKKVARRRLRTVMQDIIYMAGRLTYGGRQFFISFGLLNPFAQLGELIGIRLGSVPALE